MAAPSVTHILVNGTAADATQINTNFNDILSGFSDGTKDFVMGSGDLSGNLVVDGNTTLGDASGDTLTVNATASFANNVTLGSTSDDTLTVNATASFANNVTLGATSDDTLTVNATASFANNVTLGSTSDDTLTVNATASFANNVTLGATSDDTLTVNATASFANNVTLGATADDDITMNGVVAENILMADGKGIDFSRCTDYSVAGRTITQILTDYEVGTWTPYDGSGAGLTLTVYSASYIKIGYLVWINMMVDYPQTTNGSMAIIGGLPYIPSNNCSFPMFLGTFPNQGTNLESAYVFSPDLGVGSLALARTNFNMSQARVAITGSYHWSGGYN